jgi:hypothetical protein
LLMHWYAATEVASQLPCVDETLPRPDTSPLQMSWPLLLIEKVGVPWKLAAAVAAEADSAAMATTSERPISHRVCVYFVARFDSFHAAGSSWLASPRSITVAPWGAVLVLLPPHHLPRSSAGTRRAPSRTKRLSAGIFSRDGAARVDFGRPRVDLSQRPVSARRGPPAGEEVRPRL